MDQKQKTNATISAPADNQNQAAALLCDPPVRANYTTDGGNCGDRGAQPSNTAPANCINHETNSTSVLHTGIDSLYVSYRGDLFPEIEDALEQRKNFAQSAAPDEQSKAYIALNGHNFQVKANGKGKFVYVIVDNWFDIHIARSTAKSIPMVYVQIRSELLTVSGINNAMTDLNKTVSEIGVITREAQISRVDICTDFATDIDFLSSPRQAWVSRSLNFHNYYNGNDLTGYVFGEGSDLSCRLYNKTTEIKKSKKAYFAPIWISNGWNGLSTVWRLEFQYRSSVLSELNIRTIDDLKQKLSSLWEYSTQQWLRLTLPSPTDATQSRWPLHPLWSILVNAEWSGEKGEPLSRVRKSRIPHDEYLYINGISAITSIMARDGLADFDEAIEQFRQETHSYHYERSEYTGQSLNHYARDKASLKAVRYNTVENDSFEALVTDFEKELKERK